jgi:hypothetical protein
VDKDIKFHRCRALGLFCLILSLVPPLAASRSLDEAQVTAIIGDGALVQAGENMRPISPNERLRAGIRISTLADTRAELTFDNQFIARLSAGATINFDKKNLLELIHGAVLVEIPRGTRAKIKAGEVAASISGATAVLEYQPPAFKCLVLEGTARLYRPWHLGDSILVGAGRMTFGDARAALTDPVDFDIDRFVKTCPLIEAFAPLGNEKLMAIESQKQQLAKSKKRLVDTNLVIFGGGSTVSAIDPAGALSSGNQAADSERGIPSSGRNSPSTQKLAEAQR